MKQYIDKDALVAEIEERRDGLISLSESCLANTAAKSGFYAQAQTLDGIKNFIDTLEVQNMDLEKHLKEDIEDVFFDLDGVAVKGATSYLTVEDIKDIAKHFFELGLKSQKGE